MYVQYVVYLQSKLQPYRFLIVNERLANMNERVLPNKCERSRTPAPNVTQLMTHFLLYSTSQVTVVGTYYRTTDDLSYSTLEYNEDIFQFSVTSRKFCSAYSMYSMYSTLQYSTVQHTVALHNERALSVEG